MIKGSLLPAANSKGTMQRGKGEILCVVLRLFP